MPPGVITTVKIKGIVKPVQSSFWTDFLDGAIEFFSIAVNFTRDLFARNRTPLIESQDQLQIKTDIQDKQDLAAPVSQGMTGEEFLDSLESGQSIFEPTRPEQVSGRGVKEVKQETRQWSDEKQVLGDITQQGILSEEPLQLKEEFDSRLEVGTFVPHKHGVSIYLENNSADMSNRWVQTIDTSVPLGGNSTYYVDPRPADDSKPFYYTDEERKLGCANFSDSPARSIPQGDDTTWTAILSEVKVDGNDIIILDTIKYGFTINEKGVVTPLDPQPVTKAEIRKHIQQIEKEYPNYI